LTTLGGKDLFAYKGDGMGGGNWIVIPTNGVVKANGDLVMGAGVAKRAKEILPTCPGFFGYIVKEYGLQLFAAAESHFIMFPTKHHFKDPSDIQLLEKSCKELRDFVAWHRNELFYMPKVGCGNGGLKWEVVEPVLDKYLGDFTNVFVVYP
jgi:hypothetical protein